MYTVSKPERTMEIVFDEDEWDVIQNYAKWQGVEPNFFASISFQNTLATITKLFPRKLMMPGYLDRELKKFPPSREKVEVHGG